MPGNNKTHCVYCDAEVTPTKAAVKVHVRQCPKGPLAELKKCVHQVLAYDKGLSLNSIALLHEALRDAQ